MAETYEAFRVTRDANVAHVTLVGPGKGNALGPAFWRESAELARTLDADESVRAIVLRGAGDHFSYGLDLPAMMGELAPLLTGEQAAWGRTRLLAQVERMQEACEAWAKCRKPVVAALHGWCIGGALHLAAACDVRICSSTARFSLREVRLAIVPDLGALQRLPRIVGDTHARQLALTGMDFDAERAERMGLVSERYGDDSALFEASSRLAAQLASLPPLTVQGIKQVMNFSADATLVEGLRASALWSAAFLQSEDFLEAQAAFIERRAAQFKGR